MFTCSLKREAQQIIDIGSSSDEDEQALICSPAGKRRRADNGLPWASDAALHAAPGESDAAFAERLQREEREAQRESQEARMQMDALYALQLQHREEDVVRSNSAASKVLPSFAAPICSSSSSSRLCLPPTPKMLGCRHCFELQASLPRDLVATVRPIVDVCGTQSEPLVYVKNVDGCQGRLLVGRVLSEISRMGMTPPAPRPRQRSGIIVEWHRNKRSQTPWRTGVRVLGDLADQVLTHLRLDVPVLQRPSRAWSDTEVLVTTPGCKLGRHTDAQPAGSLLCIFCAGLSCLSLAWPGGKLVQRRLESGDMMIFDGKLTPHAVPEVIQHTSPFPHCPWLGQRRLSVLVREQPLPKGTRA